MNYEDDIRAQEAVFVELKSEIEEFLRFLGNNPPLAELRDKVNEMFKLLQNYFVSIGVTQRQLHELQLKITAHIHTKKEAIKSIDDDNDRYDGLCKEFDAFYFKIDQAKYEEQEKDKLYKELGDKIIKLNQQKDQENFSNIKSQEQSKKQELTATGDMLDNELGNLFDRKRQCQEQLDNLYIEHHTAEITSTKLNEEHSRLEAQLRELAEKFAKEKDEKKQHDMEFERLKKENAKLKDDLANVKAEGERLFQVEKRTNEDFESVQEEVKKAQKAINEYKNKKIPAIKGQIQEDKEKLEKLEEANIDLMKDIAQRNKERAEFAKIARQYSDIKQENQRKIDKLYNEELALLEEKKKLKDEINAIEAEIRKKEMEFSILKTEMIKDQKLDDQKNRKLEALANEVFEIDKQLLALNNANRRMEIEIKGMKRETIELDVEQANAEKEKNLYAKLASDANMDHTQALEKLKKLDEAINELKEKNAGAESKLKQQKKIYDALKADSKRFEKKYSEALNDIKNIEEDKLKKNAKYHALKKDLVSKQEMINKTDEKLKEYQEAVDKDTRERNDLKKECTEYKTNCEKYMQNINNLKKMISQAEQDLQNQKKEMQVVLSERDFLAEQLIQRNEEIKALYEKIKSLQQEEVKMHQQYEKLLLQIEGNRSTREYLLQEFTKTENIIKNIFELKVVKIKLEKEVLVAKNKVTSLENETKKPLNIHRWTKLEYSDPEKYELISQINSLQRRLIAKTEEVQQKEELIQEKEKLYIKLKHIVARQSGADMEEPLAKYQAKIKEEAERLKRLKEEIKSNQMEIRNYEYEIRRIVNETEKLKQLWYAKRREENENENDGKVTINKNRTHESLENEEKINNGEDYEEYGNDREEIHNFNDNQNDQESVNPTPSQEDEGRYIENLTDQGIRLPPQFQSA